MSELALIVGAGPGLSASLARLCVREGMRVALAARNVAKLSALAEDTGASVRACDASRREDVDTLFDAVLDAEGVPDLVVYNPSARVRGAVADLDPEAVERAIAITAYGGFLVGRRAAIAMRERGSGSIQFTGASASVKGYPESGCFAMGKFALRGLAQSMARELAPKGIHVAHFVIDGGIESQVRIPDHDEWLDPDAIAQTYLNVHRQHRSAWTWEVELRPWVERF
ncbi:MAG: SDR family NAD(P)-dependent oxidoreductase [Chromatiales bacterium]|nr:SDR family NAD(P)-dependent oxidoreductase [Chromatiales bacterium]